MSVHSVVLATILLEQAKAAKALAQLRSRMETVPATIRGNNDTLRLSKQIKEQAAIVAGWDSVAREAAS